MRQHNRGVSFPELEFGVSTHTHTHTHTHIHFFKFGVLHNPHSNTDIFYLTFCVLIFCRPTASAYNVFSLLCKFISELNEKQNYRNFLPNVYCWLAEREECLLHELLPILIIIHFVFCLISPSTFLSVSTIPANDIVQCTLSTFFPYMFVKLQHSCLCQIDTFKCNILICIPWAFYNTYLLRPWICTKFTLSTHFLEWMSYLCFGMCSFALSEQDEDHTYPSMPCTRFRTVVLI